jgi:nicotinate phosphoribosyltransferase
MLGTSADAPYLGAVYKLVEDARGGRAKLSTGKRSWPGRKQVYRQADRDVIALADAPAPPGRPLLARVMAGGRRLGPPEPLDDVRRRRAEAVAALPAELLSLARRAEYPVERVGEAS